MAEGKEIEVVVFLMPDSALQTLLQFQIACQQDARTMLSVIIFSSHFYLFSQWKLIHWIGIRLWIWLLPCCWG